MVCGGVCVCVHVCVYVCVSCVCLTCCDSPELCVPVPVALPNKQAYVQDPLWASFINARHQ